jgi:hypothetical protein
MTRRTAAVALVAWLIGFVVLGRSWQGVQTSSGAWGDGVSLWQWVVCWVLLALLALAVGHRLRGWTARALALLPLATWIVWQLSGGALGPIPMVIYLAPTCIVWAVGLQVGQVVGARLARSV